MWVDLPFVRTSRLLPLTCGHRQLRCHLKDTSLPSLPVIQGVEERCLERGFIKPISKQTTFKTHIDINEAKSQSLVKRARFNVGLSDIDSYYECNDERR